MDPDLVGRTLLGALRVVRPLGAGGMGTVYEVEHLPTARRCALKVLHAALAQDAQAVARLIREASIGAQIRSPRVVETFDVGRLEDGRVFIRMALLEGRSLKDRLAESGALPAAEVARLGVQVGEGLAAAHAAGVVHRDLTPANIFLIGPRGSEEVKLLDFGLSKMLPGHTDRFGALTEAGTLLGTPSYMAPEQASSRAVDTRADQYALGVVLYECLTGDKPFSADGLPALLACIARGDHIPLRARLPNLDPAFADAIERAMSVDPDARFATVAELTEAARAFAVRAGGRVGPTQPVSAYANAAPLPGTQPLSAAGAPRWPGPQPTVPLAGASSHPGVAPPGAGVGPPVSTAPIPAAAAAPLRTVSLSSSAAPISPERAPHPPASPPMPRAGAAARRTGSSVAPAIAIALFAAVGGVVVLGGAMLATRAYLARDGGGRAEDAARPAADPSIPPGDAPLLHDDMTGYPELQAMLAAGEYRRCLDFARDMPQTVHVLEHRVSCAANIQDWRQYREACMALSNIDPANETVRHCMPALANIP